MKRMEDEERRSGWKYRRSWGRRREIHCTMILIIMDLVGIMDIYAAYFVLTEI